MNKESDANVSENHYVNIPNMQIIVRTNRCDRGAKHTHTNIIKSVKITVLYLLNVITFL